MTNNGQNTALDTGIDTATLLANTITLLNRTTGLSEQAAKIVAKALIDADQSGTASHGVMLLPMYVERLKAGSISLAEQGTVISNNKGSIVLDAEHILGQLSSAQAIKLLKIQLQHTAIAAVAVRHGFHFGAAGYWARQLAKDGFIGIVMSSTRPLMAVPGGAERSIGNNPLAIAMPTDTDDYSLMIDMALSNTAMGKIRLAADKNSPIPNSWALDASGQATTDPLQAIKGMLLPAAGYKGFGLAVMIDMLCGGLSGGAISKQIQPLYGDKTKPYDCCHLFIALDIKQFLPLSDFAKRAQIMATDIQNSAKATGTKELFSPGQRSYLNRQKNQHWCPLSISTAQNLQALSATCGLGNFNLFQLTNRRQNG